MINLQLTAGATESGTYEPIRIDVFISDGDFLHNTGSLTEENKETAIG